MTSQDDLLQAVDEACERIVAFLGESKVPEQSLATISKLAADHAAEDVLERAEEMGYCMPYMNHGNLVRLLTTAWVATCGYKQLLRKKAFRLCMRLEADNKTDPDELEEARRRRDEMDRSCALANLKLYKMRFLKLSYDAEHKAS